MNHIFHSFISPSPTYPHPPTHSPFWPVTFKIPPSTLMSCLHGTTESAWFILQFWFQNFVRCGYKHVKLESKNALKSIANLHIRHKQSHLFLRGKFKLTQQQIWIQSIRYINYNIQKSMSTLMSYSQVQQNQSDLFPKCAFKFSQVQISIESTGMYSFIV